MARSLRTSMIWHSNREDDMPSEHPDYRVPWHDEVSGEAYADAPEHEYFERGAYADVVETLLVSPWLIQRLDATPMMIDGHPSVEIMMTIVRDYDRAAEVCPHEGYDVLGFHNGVSLALRANRHGRWNTFVPSVGGFRSHPLGDGATVDLGQHEVTAAWRFTPEMLGQFEMWAFVAINGVFVPFDAMMASPFYIDANSAAKMTVLL